MSAIVLPIVLFVLALIIVGGGSIKAIGQVNAVILFSALGASVVRLLASYALSLVVGIPLALIAEANRRIESILLPIYDVMESMPILAFFPVIILFFVRYDWLEAAAIFIIFFNMLWNLVFNVIGGLKVIPRDIHAVADVFGYRGLARFRTFTLPAIFPSIVTGTILAFAEGWNMLIVAEVLHTYAPQSSGAADLFGIGSILVSSASAGDNATFLAATALILVAVVAVNLLVWQPLLMRSERYKFE